MTMRFLINRSDAIGDTILTTPMAKMLKEKYPDCHITFLVSTRTNEILESHPYIDEVQVYNRNLRFYHKIKRIISIFRSNRPTHYFYVGGGYLPNFVAWLSRVGFRGGLKSRWHTFLFLNHGIRQKRSMVSMHELEYNLNLLSPLGIKYHYSELERFIPVLVLKDDEVSAANKIFDIEIEKAGLDKNKKLIFIHPGMTGHTLNWSSRNYGRFIIKHHQNFKGQYNYIVSHTPADEKFLIGLRDILNHEENVEILKDVYFFNGAIHGIRFYMAILQKAALFLGPSTGTLHIAAALGVPAVGIYSPIKVQSSKRWGPVAVKDTKVKVLVPNVICGEVNSCAERDCPYFECMGKIEVDDAFKASIRVME